MPERNCVRVYVCVRASFGTRCENVKSLFIIFLKAYKPHTPIHIHKTKNTSYIFFQAHLNSHTDLQTYITFTSYEQLFR